ncbi:DUF5004 domain-containing protein [Tamlana sp. s12]|uniref:DUF5004 domain-containing protein n=1 Tax=Tamlana sp. s12 TaxID=1630406 RepID=UPI0007FC183B|nr:DUF5004 domain-containing protein [Tamlana sp. s12]OBQ55300.1 hypothetical protein VQ01_07400 [Tamlana sp. s12]QQY81027.1 DUF5004 domain-containing protein [Tamlana sp. s12]
MKKSILAVKSIVSLCLISGLIFSCDNNDDNDMVCQEEITGDLTEHETAFAGEWILKSIVADEEIDLTDDDTDNPSTDIFAQYDECQQDAVHDFQSDRAYIFEVGLNAADCDDQQKVEGTWKLSDENMLTILSNCVESRTALELNEENTEFTVENTVVFTDVNDEEMTLKITTTYAKSAGEDVEEEEAE